MKARIIALLVLSFIGMAQAAEEEILCSMLNLRTVSRQARLNSTYDKNIHCAVSCMLSLRCPYTEVAQAGVLKEIGDLLGLGDPDLEDIQANLYGIGLVYRREARFDRECLSGCNQRYFKHRIRLRSQR
jgi:hypothetical protein